MSSPSPLEYEQWRRQPTIIIDLSLPEEVTLTASDGRRQSAHWMSLSARAAAMALGVFCLAGDWTASALSRAPTSEVPLRAAVPARPSSAATPDGVRSDVPPSGASQLRGQLNQGGGASMGAGVSAEPAKREVSIAGDELAGAEEAADRTVIEVPGHDEVVLSPGLSKEQRAINVRETLREARQMSEQGDHDGARATFRRALALEPGHLPALRGLARTALAMGELDVALHIARRTVMRGPFAPEHQLLLGDVLRARGSLAEAEVAYQRASKLRRRPLDRAARSLPPNPF